MKNDLIELVFSHFCWSQVLNVNPQNGEVIKTVNFPAMFITSVAFGGPNFEDLYVTSSCDEGIIPTYKTKADDGWTFVVTGTGARGLPAIKMQL